MDKTRPSRILITGVTGFVGSYLVEHCRTHYSQAEIFGLYHCKAPQPTSTRVKSLKADITQAEDVRQALAESCPDVIFHLAAQVSVAASWSDPVQTLQVNALGAVRLLEAARLEQPTARIVLVGMRVRAFNHFGPRQSDAFVLPGFARQIALIEAGKAEPVVLVGNLQAKRDFLPVRDVVAAYLAVAERGQPGQVYNVGSGKARSIGEILDLLLTFTNMPIRLREDLARMRPVDIPILEADISRIQAQTGWKPTISFESALKETLDYWRAVIATA